MKRDVKWLKTYVDAEIKAIRRAVDKVEKTNSNAVNKVQETYKSDKASSNEWRGQLKDQAGTFVTRRELWGAAVAIIGIVLGIMAYMK